MIYIDVKKQKLDVSYDKVVAESINFLAVKFSFSKEWEGYAITATFHNAQRNEGVSLVLNSDMDYYVGEDTYLVPFEVIYSPEFTVSIIGTKENSRITTDICTIPVEQCGTQFDNEGRSPTLSEYEQILIIAENANQIALSVKEDAKNGAFNGEKGDKGEKGEKGDKGEKGEKGADGYTPVREIDYWTSEDIALIKAYVDEAIIGGEW